MNELPKLQLTAKLHYYGSHTRIQLTGQDGKRTQTLIATMTPTSPGAHGHAYGLVAQTLIRTGHHAQDNDPL